MDAYGPPLPPGFKISDNEDSGSEDDQSRKPKKVIGPQIPEFIIRKSEDNSNSSDSDGEKHDSQMIGPTLPKFLKDNVNDDETYGPMPPQTNVEYDVVNMIEKRAANMRNKLDNKDTPVVESSQREEWMVVPDTSRRNQLGAISRCLAPGSKVKKREAEYHNPEEEEKIAEALKKYNKKKRNESLLDMHSKKMKKKDKKEKKDRDERKPFDRDEIAVRHFSKEQVNSVIEKSKFLNSRFAPGKKHYL